MSKNRSITIEGYTRDELLSLPEEQIDSFILCDEPIAFRIGSAEILAQFRVNDDTLTIELAHIDGGGEGVLQLEVDRGWRAWLAEWSDPI